MYGYSLIMDRMDRGEKFAIVRLYIVPEVECVVK